jgi:hypothetical protein
VAIELTDTQLAILRALCRPVATGNRFATPATNQEIADEVFLSVDAIKSHLRTLYRKFAIEELPHNQKRARLVELVLEGGYLGEESVVGGEVGEGSVVTDEVAPAVAPPVTGRPTGAAAAAPPRGRRRWPLAGAALVAVAAIVVAILALSGAFDSGGDSGPTTGTASYRQQVRGYCRLALAGQSGGEPAGRVARAREYLEVIETMRGRLASLAPPATSDEALERFRHGLSRAADFTSLVAQGPPTAGSRQEANAVAELTFAAGQVQAGALGFDLGRRCVAIGDLVARSAQNAAAP